jgi:hypothetical protein
MNKIYLMIPFFLFGVTSLSHAATDPSFETFLKQWDMKTKSVAQRKDAILRNQSLRDRGQEENTTNVPAEVAVFQNNPKAAALYDVFSNFKRAFNPQEIKKHVLEVCKEISKDPSATDACTAQLVQHREAVCKASPLIARDTCADILQNAFPSNLAPSVRQGTPLEKSPSFRDKLKFWKKV